MRIAFLTRIRALSNTLTHAEGNQVPKAARRRTRRFNLDLLAGASRRAVGKTVEERERAPAT